MKKQLILAGISIFSTTLNAQWFGPAPHLYTSNQVRVGGAAALAAGTTFHVGDGAGALHFTGTGSGGMLIKPSVGDRALLELHDPSGIGRTVFQTLSWGTYLTNVGTQPLYVQLTAGARTGFGTLNPTDKLTAETGIANDGIGINQTSSGASALHLYNSTSGGNHWALFSTGQGNGQGSGNFSIYQYGASSDRLFINGNNGYVGIGNIAPTHKLHVTGTVNGIRGDATNGATAYAIQGLAYGVNNQGLTIGSYGQGASGASNYGGYFRGVGGSGTAIGVFGAIVGTSNPGSDFAGYFNGDVYRSGTDNFTSDRKLKNDIQPLTSALAKIMQLKPSTYTFKTEEYKMMGLPKGKQMGLIAQELELVFPELVTNMRELKLADENGGTITVPEFKAVQYISLIPVLIAGMQEQQKQIEKLEQVNAELLQNTQKISGSNAVNTSLADIQLMQNEPNPFSTETTVKYTLPQTVNTAYIAVYDLSGKQLERFSIQEKGTASITISSEKLKAGMYIYSIIADGKVFDSKRMVIETR